jgi:hypothetical protein
MLLLPFGVLPPQQVPEHARNNPHNHVCVHICMHCVYPNTSKHTLSETNDCTLSLASCAFIFLIKALLAFLIASILLVCVCK